MQRGSCEDIGLLLSKYADNEATLGERERVIAHIAGCAECARKLAGFEEVAAIFSSQASHPPDPRLRVGLFREINHLKEEEQRKTRQARESRPWYLPAPAPVTPGRRQSRFERIWGAASPFVATTLAVCAILGLALFADRQSPNKPVRNVREMSVPPIPTQEPPLPVADLTRTEADTTFPSPVGTKAAFATFMPNSPDATVLPTAIGEGVAILSHSTPVLEGGDVSDRASWHVVRDPAYGYAISYPPNWWTQVAGETRSFWPWVAAGMSLAPYWIELSVKTNSRALTAESANKVLFDGRGALAPGSIGSPVRLRHSVSDGLNSYDELYAFSSKQIYELRLVVPKDNPLSSFQQRWKEAQAVFSQMSKANLVQDTSSSSTGSGYSPILFLNGTDLWSFDPATSRTGAITHGGYIVRHFALSPDLRTVAFTSAKNLSDPWARTLYIAYVDETGNETPILRWADTSEIHDIAWYSDHELLAIARTPQAGLGVFRIAVPGKGQLPEPDQKIEPIALLGEAMFGANGLAVSPDRQLITFMAPVGESAGTDLYRLRPDGTDLQALVRHSEPLSPLIGSGPGRVLALDSQAIKSYVWTGGHLQYGGYSFNLLFTCGNAASPTLYRGGFLYSAPGASHNDLLDHNRLGVSDPARLQIVHTAYSTSGKLAFTGYYNDYGGMADQLTGLWTADVANGDLGNIRAWPVPQAHHGITDLQWSADGESLIYRETMPRDYMSLSARYTNGDPFAIVKVDLSTGAASVLYSTGPR